MLWLAIPLLLIALGVAGWYVNDELKNETDEEWIDRQW